MRAIEIDPADCALGGGKRKEKMAGKFLLEVVTPEKQLLSQQVDEVIAPGSEGEFGVLPGHCHFLSTLKIGELRYRIDDQTNSMAILWGFAEVTPTKVTIMAEIAEKSEDIDVERAIAKVAEAERRLQAGGLPSEVKEAQISLEKARLRKKIAERARKTGHA
jgi:F-type H+-transporting ATPase subunit epsilon